MWRTILNIFGVMDRVSTVMIRPMVFFLLGELCYLVLKGVSMTYGCS